MGLLGMLCLISMLRLPDTRQAVQKNNLYGIKAMDEVIDPAAGSLLRSKLIPPQASGEYLVRPRSEAGSAVAWLSLGPGDDEPWRFLQQLVEALAPLVPGLGSEAQAYLQNTMRVPVSAVMESLLADLAQLEQPLLLVLDDLHLIQDRELLAALNRLIKFAPAAFTLAIGSRSQPALNLATLRAKGLLVEIGEQELRLSKAETRTYLERCGLHLDAVAFNALYNKTEGWMVGVHLASLWLRHQPQDSVQIAEMGTDQAAVGAYLLRSV